MFRRLDKTDWTYFAGLVFMMFPFLGIGYFGYPLWTLPFTLLFLIAYLLLIQLKLRYVKTIECLWWYILLYIALMTCFVNGNMMWFFFYPANLLVWRFKKSWRSYRGLSLLVTVLGISLFGMFYTSQMADKIAIGLIVLFMLGMVNFMIGTREESELREQLYQKTKENSQLIAENERHRISRDLHDTLGHTFAMMSLKTELALKQLDRGNHSAVQTELEELRLISRQSMKEVRTIITNLAYRRLDEELTALTQLFELADISFDLVNGLETVTLSPNDQSHLGMICKELANNVIKHSQARACHLSLEAKGERLIVTMTDDGKGFDALSGQELHSIRGRLGLMTGEVTIVSLAKPTIVSVTLIGGDRL